MAVIALDPQVRVYVWKTNYEDIRRNTERTS
jgi:hypothetical protein